MLGFGDNIFDIRSICFTYRSQDQKFELMILRSQNKEVVFLINRILPRCINVQVIDLLSARLGKVPT